MKKDNVYFPLLFTSFVAWYFLFPWRHICKRKIKLYKLIEDDADQDYKNQVVHFYEDYVRSNPITKKTAWENWLGIVKKKKGKNEEEDMRKRISTLINGKSPVKNFAIQNYKLEEGRRSLFLKSSARDFKKPNSDLEISPMPRLSEGRDFQRRSFHANPFRIRENNP